MNEKFLELPREKQLRIINAGMEYFGKYGYQKAVTDDIAARAGISKGLLFYYFHNKKSFYMYLYQQCEDILKEYIADNQINQMTDFFDIMSYGAEKKMELLNDYPYMMNFILKAFYSQTAILQEDVNQMIHESMNDVFEKYFYNVDFSRFKDDVDPRKIYEMLTWMSEGYLLDKQRLPQPISIEEMIEEFNEWKDILRRMCYKEEYL